MLRANVARLMPNAFRPCVGHLSRGERGQKAMKRLRHSRIASWLIIFSMILSLSTGIMVGGRASAHTNDGQPAPHDSTHPTAAYPALARYAIDLTSEAEAGRLEQFVGRDTEIKRGIELLAQQAGKT